MTTTKLATYWERHARVGAAFYCLTDTAPEWIKDAVREAHGDESPDDWVHEQCYDVCIAIDNGAIGGPDDAAEWADSNGDVYTAALLRWAAGDLNRLSYCDEAASEGLITEKATMEERLRIGQFVQLERIARAIAAAVAEAVEQAWDASQAPAD